jgi:transcriptional regulator with XRE-family HTH domain
MTHPNRGYLRKLRQDAGLSQAALAQRVGIGASSVAAYEHNGRPVPPAVLAAIEAACADQHPSIDVPHHAPPAAPPVASPDAPDAPLFVVDQREPPSAAVPTTYTLAQLEALARAYWEQVVQEQLEEHMHPSVYDDTEGVLSAFLAHLATQEQEARTAQAFTTACVALAQTGDVGAYTAAVLTAQQAGLTPARIADLMHEALRTSETRLRVTLLHEGNAPWVRDGKGD